MRYCPNSQCSQPVWQSKYDGAYCGACGEELTPCIQCRCGKTEYNPRTPEWMPTFCPHCRAEFTDAYLGQCMAAQLKGLVAEISQKYATSLN